MEAVFTERENPLIAFKAVGADIHNTALADLFVEASYLFLTLAVFADYSAVFRVMNGTDKLIYIQS